MSSAYNLYLDPKVRKFLKGLKDKKTKQKLVDLIEKIKLDPLLGIKLKGDLSSYYRVRYSSYRIIYTFDSIKKNLRILKIDDRKQVYK